MKSDGFPRSMAIALGIALTIALSFFVAFVSSGIKSQLFGIQEYDHRRGGDAMLFPDWLAIAVLLFVLVWAVSAWIRQHKSQDKDGLVTPAQIADAQKLARE